MRKVTIQVDEGEVTVDAGTTGAAAVVRLGSALRTSVAGNRRAGRRATAVHLATGTQVISADRDGRKVLVENAEGARQIAYRSLVLATGAREIFLPFPGWTLPGVMGVGGLQALVRGGLQVDGKRV